MSVLTVDLRVARDDFELRVAADITSRVTGVFGRSGAGKSTLLHAVAGLERLTSGRIAVGDRVLADVAARVHVPPHARSIGVVFQDARLFPHVSVRRNLRYGLRDDAEASGIREEDVIDLLDLGHLLDRRPRTLSGGEKQRVALGRALLASPRLLLLDEPMASLDRTRKRQILPFLTRVRDAFAVPMLYVSHDLEEVLQLTDELLVLEDGAVIGHGRFASLAMSRDAPFAAADVANVLTLPVASVAVDEVAMALSGGGTMHGPPGTAVAGGQVTVAIRPEEIALSSTEVDGISVRNQLPGRVAEITERDGVVWVRVEAGASFIVRITSAAASAMSMSVGDRVWCLVKVSAIRYLGDGAPVATGVDASP